ncbi:MAG TPA: hypothetical protein ENG87_05850 [Candidatus Pacearchaeota archaeon]|nr:hypothetical protein [Candidatus Pacearchaeota archaeon]
MNFREKETHIIKGTHKRPTFLVAIPTFGMVHISFHIAAQRLQMPTNAAIESIVTIKKEIGEAREYIINYYLSKSDDIRPDYLFFLGDDMLPPWDALINLHHIMTTENWDVLSGLYYIKQDPPKPILWRDGIVGHLQEGVHYKLDETVISDIAGMDFTLIKPDILKKINPPYFRTGPTLTDTGGVWTHTEDAWFCKKVKEAGGRIGVATSIRIGHININTGEIY